MSRPPFSILGLDHVVLRCSRFEDTLAFYRDLLGCPLERVVASIGLHQLRAGVSLIDLLPLGGALAGDQAPDPERRNMHHFCLRVAHGDWPRLLEHLRSHGVEAEDPARRYGADGYGNSVYLRDPEGNTVELKGTGA